MAGAVIIGFGLWLLWRGITNDIRRDLFGDPLIPRWMWITGGVICTTVGLAVSAFILWQWHVAGG